jgi:hypothetical protein
LALSTTTFTVGTPSSGTITGATVGSTITASGLPTGLTINGAARTWAWDGTGTAGSGSFTLTETLLGAVGSPKTTTINYTINASSSTLSAPVLDFPSPKASNPTSITATFGIDWQSGVGESIKLAYSSSVAMTSPTILTHVITDADALAGTATISIPTLAAVTYFQAYGNDGTSDSPNKSNIVAWGNSSAPTITSSLTQSGNDGAPLNFAVTMSGVANLTLGGTDSALLQVVGTPGTSATVELLGNANTNFSTKPTYSFTLTPSDLSGNVGAAQSCTYNVSTTAQLNTTSGNNKDSLLTVTGTPALSFSGTAANGNNSVRSNVQQTSNKAQVELTITSGAATGSTIIGFEDGTTAFNTAPRGMPGLDNFAGSGIAVGFYSSGSTISVFYNGGANQVDLATTAGSIANNDTFTLVYDKVNGTLEVWRTRSGTTIQMGSTVTSLPSLSAQYCYCGTRSSTSAGTVNFGGDLVGHPYAKTPVAGVASHWGP